jgi:hypothetical protein
MRSRLVVSLILVGATMTMVGFFSPWFPHPASGLSLSGFELGEQIKFAPEVRSGAAGLKGTNLYWPPVLVALSLPLLPVPPNRRCLGRTITAFFGLVLSLVPLPILEEINSFPGIISNVWRLGLVALGMGSVVAGWHRHRINKHITGLILLVASLSGLVLIQSTFSVAESIIEKVLAQLVDPGAGYYLTLLGIAILATASIIELTRKREMGRDPEPA